MTTIPYRIHLTPEPEGGYTVTVPSILGCVTHGDDMAKALSMAREAIQGYLEALAKADRPLPEERIEEPFDATIEVAVPLSS